MVWGVNRHCAALASIALACAPNASDVEVELESKVIEPFNIETTANASVPADAKRVDAAPTAPCEDVHGQAPPLVRNGACGRLEYGLYANEGQNLAVHRLPDFSFAGYRGGGITIPTVREVERVAPGPGDDRARIQAAIDRVSRRTPNADGFRGAVVLDAGTFQVGDSLYIRANGIVLRGAGQGRDGTIVVATRRAQHSLIIVEGEGQGLDETSPRIRITSNIVPVGATAFDVASTSGLAPGDLIAVIRTPNQRWIDDLGMDRFGADDTPWTPQSYTIAHERTITAIQGRRVTVDIPIVDAMETNYGGGAIATIQVPGRRQQCGVEDLRLVSEFDGNTDENHAWNAVRLQRTENSWVRRVTALHFGYAAVTLGDRANFNTIEEVAQLDPISQITGGRRYSFNISSGMGNLFQRCYARNGRHNFVTGARVTGPNVWLDCLSTQNHSDEGPHHRWATGLLFDNISSADLNVQNRRGSGTGHGWAGAQTMFWNADVDRFICDAPQGAMNWLVGTTGAAREGRWAPEEPRGYWESQGQRVTPRSLYLKQLQDRLSFASVRAVTTEAQRAGTIWTQLRTWAGEGRLSDASTPTDPTCQNGIRSGDVCCASSCGTCGGTGCSGRPGGADACCTGAIRDSEVSCSEAGAPCNIPTTPVCDGIQSGDICCADSCGTCGGAGCGGRPGGAAACCTSTIRNSQVSCSQSGAPCIMPVPPMCDGIQSGDVCCANSCGSCGGSGCSGRPGGAAACCTSSIRQSGRSCANFDAPCLL
ncbi:MAG: hypothetical protein AAFN74_03455 [Myxococcota bacterium]